MFGAEDVDPAHKRHRHGDRDTKNGNAEFESGVDFERVAVCEVEAWKSEAADAGFSMNVARRMPSETAVEPSASCRTWYQATS